MLLLNKRPILSEAAACIMTFLAGSGFVRNQVQQFLDRPAPEAVKTVHVLQGEYAVVRTLQETMPLRISSSEATTCCLVAMNCRQSGRAGIAHFDQPGAEDAECLTTLMRDMIEPDLYIVGSFTEATGCGTRTAKQLLQTLQNCDTPVHIQLACIGPMNTTAIGAPKSTNLALTFDKTQVCASPCPEQLDKGPQALQRLARLWTQTASNLIEVYDTSAQKINVVDLDVRLTTQQMQTFKALVQLPDSQLLNYVSTSPGYEASTFASDIAWQLACSLVGHIALLDLFNCWLYLQKPGQCLHGCSTVTKPYQLEHNIQACNGVIS